MSLDVNECRKEPSPCESNTVCENTKGSYRCNCKTGFIQESHHCVGNSAIIFVVVVVVFCLFFL